VTGTTPDFVKLAGELEAHAASEAMAEAVLQAATTAAAGRQAKFPLIANSELEPPSTGDPSEAWTTDWGNTWKVLQAGAKSADNVALIKALVALGMRKNFPSSPEQELTSALHLVWLAAHTPCNAFEPLDIALGEGKRTLWQAVAKLVEDPSACGEPIGRTERLIAAVSLRNSESETAREVSSELSQRLEDPILAAILRRETPALPEQELRGELCPAPKSPVLTALLAVTFILAAMHVTRLIGRHVFAYKRPAKLTLSQRGLELTYHTEFLGTVLRQRATLVPLGNLASVTREVRFARLGMYAGLVALVVGSYWGMRLFIEGLRAPGGSATLLGLAALLMLVGLAIDFALSSLSDSAKGKCRIVLVPRKGRSICVGSLGKTAADSVLAALAEKARP
jgi:hypothetical protein